MNIDKDGYSLIATWNNAADRAINLFQKIFINFSTSSLSIKNESKNYNDDEDDGYNLFGIDYEQLKWKKPLTYDELKNCFLDSDGRIVQSQELRQRIYEGGCEPSIRKFCWRYLLNIFPLNYTSQERYNYLKILTNQYEQLKSYWFNKEHILNDPLVKSIAIKIQKDVNRTDRTQSFYSGGNELTNENIKSLYNILLTFSLTHSSISYSQGMSDLLSPLLYVLKDEAQAYVCFCVCMKRLKTNFSIFSDTIESNIRLLSLLLKEYCPKLWSHFENVGCEQLVFVYRWLLLECKREFPFDDMLRVLEIMWSTIKFDVAPMDNEKHINEQLYLYEDDLIHDTRPTTPATTVHTIIRRSRKNSKNIDGYSSSNTKCRKSLKYQLTKTNSTRIKIVSVDDTDEQEYETDDSEEDQEEIEDEQQTIYLKNDFFNSKKTTYDIRSIFERSIRINDKCDDSRKQSCSTNCSCSNSLFNNSFSSFDGNNDTCCGAHNRLELPSPNTLLIHDISTPVNTEEDENVCVTSKSCTTAAADKLLPKPIIDSGYVSDVTSSPFFNYNQEDLIYLLQKTNNPFLLFLCLTLFIEQSDYILKNQMDSNDIACYFDKMCRKHNSKQILNKARYLYSKLYLSKLNVFNYFQQLMHIQNSP